MRLAHALHIFKKPLPLRCRNALVLTVAAAALSFPFAAGAQFYGRWGGGYGPYGYYYGGYGVPYGGPPPYYPDDEWEPGSSYRGPAYDASQYGAYGTATHGPDAGPSSKEAGVVPAETIRRRITAAGFRLVAPPRHKGNIYLAEVEDAKSIRHRLVYDAHDGHLLENTALGPVKKPDAPAPGMPPAPAARTDQ